MKNEKKREAKNENENVQNNGVANLPTITF